MRHLSLALVAVVLCVVQVHAYPLRNDILAGYDPEPGMRVAIELAKQAVANGEAPYGAVIVDPVTSVIMARGGNNASQNPIWHAEMEAITDLARRNPHTTVYKLAPRLVLLTSAESCPMCMSAIEWSGFAAVYYGTSIPYLLSLGLHQINIRDTYVAQRTSWDNTTVVGGVLEAETNKLYHAHAQRVLAGTATDCGHAHHH